MDAKSRTITVNKNYPLFQSCLGTPPSTAAWLDTCFFFLKNCDTGKHAHMYEDKEKFGCQVPDTVLIKRSSCWRIWRFLQPGRQITIIVYVARAELLERERNVTRPFSLPPASVPRCHGNTNIVSTRFRLKNDRENGGTKKITDA